MNLIQIVGSFLISSSLLVTSNVAIAPDIPPERPNLPVVKSLGKEAIISLIKQKSAYYGVEAIIPIAIVEAESSYKVNAVGDGGNSYGLVQIHLPSHPTITKEQALDPYFAIDFLVLNLSKGKCKMWSTCPL